LVAAGEFQVNVQVPANIPTGSYPLTIAVGSASSADAGITVVLPVVNP